jgi:hypothetical protein
VGTSRRSRGPEPGPGVMIAGCWAIPPASADGPWPCPGVVAANRPIYGAKVSGLSPLTPTKTTSRQLG